MKWIQITSTYYIFGKANITAAKNKTRTMSYNHISMRRWLKYSSHKINKGRKQHEYDKGRYYIRHPTPEISS